MKTFVKITGLTDPAVVALVPDGGAAGFVIDVPGAPGSITAEKAAELVDAVPREAEAWGVVVAPSADTVHRLFDDVGLDRIQVYGTIPPDLEFLEIHHLVPSLPIAAPGAGGTLPPVPPAEDYARLHLDAPGEPWTHGSRELIDWALARELVDAQPGRKVAIAGGLTPANVAEAIRTVGPWGVDVSQGVERAPGAIDADQVRAFLAAIEALERPATSS